MKKTPSITVIAGIIGIALALASLYLGAWRPYRKGQLYIAAQRNLANVRTVEGFRQNFNAVFDYYSPVGTEEITKFLANTILTILQSETGQNEEVSRELAAYIEERLFRDDVRHLLLAAQLHNVLWQRFGAAEDYEAAVDYYRQAREIGPDLPPPLYELFDLYAAAGDTESARETARMILERWPGDEKTRAFLEEPTPPEPEQ